LVKVGACNTDNSFIFACTCNTFIAKDMKGMYLKHFHYTLHPFNVAKLTRNFQNDLPTVVSLVGIKSI